MKKLYAGIVEVNNVDCEDKIREIARLRSDTYECHRYLFFIRRFINNEETECLDEIDFVALKVHYDRLKNSEFLSIEDDRMEKLMNLIMEEMLDEIDLDEMSYMEGILLDTLHKLGDIRTEMEVD